MSKYLDFIEKGDSVVVINKKDGDRLGIIIFYPAWNQFVFQAVPSTVINNECLIAITWKINLMNKQGTKESDNEKI